MNTNLETAICPVTFQVKQEMVKAFAMLTGDSSSLHVDAEFGRHTVFGANIAHGMLSVAFLSAIKISASGTGSIKRLSARFSRPVFPNQSLALEAISRNSAADRAISFSLRHPDGVQVINGTCELVESEKEIDAPLLECEPLAMPLETLEEQDLQDEQINKGDKRTFTFSITPQHIEQLRNIIRTGLSSAGHEMTTGDCSSIGHTNLLGAFMISPFVGMCIPGRLGLLTNFDISFEHNLKLNTPYEFSGQVIFKSTAAATVAETFAITEAGSGLVVAGGKINSKINKLVGAMADLSAGIST